MINQILQKSSKLINVNKPFLLILMFFLFLRLFRLDRLSTFGGDQGQDFITVRDMVLHHKWTLIGLKTSIAPFYQGPLYLYFLYPFFVLFELKPIAGAYAAVFLSSLSLIILYLTVNKYFSRETAIWTSVFYTVSPELIIYGNTPLYQNFLPVFIILTIYFLLKRNKNWFDLIFTGMLGGLGMELHFLNFTLVFSVFILFLFYCRQSFRRISLFVAGVILGLTPTILFEVRHRFLNTKLFLDFVEKAEYKPMVSAVFRQWVEGSSRFLAGDNYFFGFVFLTVALLLLFKTNAKIKEFLILKKLGIILFLTLNIMGFIFSAFGPEYPLPFWILLIIFIPAAFTGYKNKNKYLIFGLMIFLNLFTSLDRFRQNHGYNMPDGLTLYKTDNIGAKIAADAKTHKNFNVASLLDGGTRAYPFRYSIQIRGEDPRGVIEYQSNNFLYLIARSENEIYASDVWEVRSFYPFAVKESWDFGDKVYLYRLERIPGR